MTETTFWDNYIKAVRLVMAEKGFATLEATAEFLGCSEMTLYKIMKKQSPPTRDQIISILLKAGFSANWLLLDQGEMYLKQQVNMDRIFNELRSIKGEVLKWE